MRSTRQAQAPPLQARPPCGSYQHRLWESHRDSPLERGAIAAAVLQSHLSRNAEGCALRGRQRGSLVVLPKLRTSFLEKRQRLRIAASLEEMP